MPDMDVVTVNGRRYVPAPIYDITEGAERIARERADQITLKGWTPEHDDEHGDGAMVQAAECYVGVVGDADARSVAPPAEWPWDASWWRPSRDPVRNLEKAGALIAAEIDRLLRKRKADLDRRLEAMGQ